MRDKLRIIYRWCKMIMGNSVFHQKQLEGTYYLKDEIAGYYSDLRHKVTGDVIIDNEHKVPVNITSTNERVFFSIAIFQYGLGAYDLYIETGSEAFLDKFYHAVLWALVNQSKNGSWDTFWWGNPTARDSSMAQAEGASLLCRAYKEWSDVKYLNAAKRAIDFMLTPVESGGTTEYCSNGNITFQEDLRYKTIINGMIFSIWGLFDLTLVLDEIIYKKRLAESVDCLCRILPDYDRKYWSNYDLDGNIASAFYHDLHIEQLKVLYRLFEREIFSKYIRIWSGYKKSLIKSKRAFIKKAIQKITVISQDIEMIK